MEDAYIDCLSNSSCMSFISDKAKILNALYDGIANDNNLKSS